MRFKSLGLHRDLMMLCELLLCAVTLGNVRAMPSFSVVLCFFSRLIFVTVFVDRS